MRCGGVVVAVDPGMSPDLFEARISVLEPRWVMAESLLYALAQFGPHERSWSGRVSTCRISMSSALASFFKVPGFHGRMARSITQTWRAPWRPRL